MAQKVTVSVTLTPTEKKALDVIAQEWGLKSGMIVRRLILFLLQKKIDFIEIVRETEIIDTGEKNIHSMRIGLSLGEKEQFLQIAKVWDFTVSGTLRRLVRALIAGYIPRSKLYV